MHFWRFDTTGEKGLEIEVHSMESEYIIPLHSLVGNTANKTILVFGQYVYFPMLRQLFTIPFVL